MLLSGPDGVSCVRYPEYGCHRSYVHLSFKVEENRLEFRCENTMPAVAVSNKVGGIGLANIQRRLGLLYPDRYELKQIENENRYMVTLCITL